MSVLSLLIGLQASRPDGRGVSGAEFLDPLQLEPGEVEEARADRGAWASGMITFAIVRQSQFENVDATADAGAPVEAFFGAVSKALESAVHFLNRRSAEITASMRSAGLTLRFFIEVRMNQDQMDLDLPPELLAACARHRLGMWIISNDIPVSEVIARNGAPEF